MVEPVPGERVKIFNAWTTGDGRTSVFLLGHTVADVVCAGRHNAQGRIKIISKYKQCLAFSAVFAFTYSF